MLNMQVEDEMKSTIEMAREAGGREECAKVCDELQDFGGLEPDHCAAAIRVR